MEVESLGIGAWEKRSAALLDVCFHHRPDKIRHRVLRRHHHVHRPQAPLDRHVQQQLRQPLPHRFINLRPPGELLVALRPMDRGRAVGRFAMERGGSPPGRGVQGAHGGARIEKKQPPPRREGGEHVESRVVVRVRVLTGNLGLGFGMAWRVTRGGRAGLKGWGGERARANQIQLSGGYGFR